MPLPSPPFTYDDPRLIYDEHCFLYDGDDTGYSELCLNPPTQSVVRRGGKSTAYAKRYTYPSRYDELDVLFKTHLSGVNQLTVDGREKYLRYKDVLDKDPRIQIFSIKTETKEPRKEEMIVVKATPITMGSVPEQNEMIPNVVIGSQMFIKSQPKQSTVEEAQFLSQSMTFEKLNESTFSVKAALIKRETTGSFE